MRLFPALMLALMAITGFILVKTVVEIVLLVAVFAIQMSLACVAVTPRISRTHRRAYGRAALSGGSHIDCLRKVYLSADPVITDADKNWAARELEKLGRPIIYIPPKRPRLCVVK